MAYVHPRGAVFDWSGTVSIADAGIAVSDMTGWTVQAKVRSETGGFSQLLTAQWLDPAQRLLRVSAASTAAWPLNEVMHLLFKFTSPAGAAVQPVPGVFLVGPGFDDA